MGPLGTAGEASLAAAGLCPVAVQKPIAKAEFYWHCTLDSALIYKHCSAGLEIHFKVITQPHRLNLKFSSTVQTSLVFFLMILFQDYEDFDAIQLWGTACQQSTSVTNKNNKMEPG